MDTEEDDGGGIPEWVVTFGDMMSLLLTFFIMLVSLSEIKEEEKYQAMVESMHRVFGYDSSVNSMIPGSSKPRNSVTARLATAGRAKRKDVMRGGDKVNAPEGDYPRVRIIRQGERTATGTVIQFPRGKATLDEAARQNLRKQASEIIGLPQKIEIRGHAGLQPVGGSDDATSPWDLAYRRARTVADFLTQEQGIKPQRIRISVAGSNEPIHIASNPELTKQNPRVEVFLLDEITNQSAGTEEERNQRFTEDGPS